jgi:hypothetical protein
LNGDERGWTWLEQHVRESYVRLQHFKIEVTHAFKEGNCVMDRHLVSATVPESGTPWQIESMSIYELTATGKIRRIHELTRMHAGEYTGW